MKKTFTLITALCCAVMVTSTAFGALIITLPATPSIPAKPGVYVDPASPASDAITLTSAVSDFKALSKVDRKERIKNARAAIKEFKKEKKEGKDDSGSTNQLLVIILTILIPPVGVLVHEGHINNKFWIDLILTLLFYVPGLIYGLIVVLGKD